MKLPLISSKKTLTSTELENIAQLRELFNQFSSKMHKVSEVRIYLKNAFHKTDINDAFIADLENEYATQFLSKMNFLPSRENIDKLLRMKPIDQCDFHMSTENVSAMGREKMMKCVHIYPNNDNDNDGDGKECEGLNEEKRRKQMKTSRKLNQMLSNEDFEAVMKKNSAYVRKQDPVAMIKQRLAPIKKEELALFKREIVDEMISKAKDDIIDKQLFSQANDLNDTKTLTIDKIRENYLNPVKSILSNSKSVEVTKAKFRNISKAKKRDILNDQQLQFNILDVQLDKEIIDEVMKPIEVPIEIIMKDVNFILDNFPIEELIEFNDEPIPQPQSQSQAEGLKYSQKLHHKIKSISKEDITLVYHKIQSKEVYRIIGLTINLVYWIVFGKVNRIQIDQPTKHYLFIKLLKEIETLSDSHKEGNKTHMGHRLYIKAFLPLLIIVIRYECQNIFLRKFKLLFKHEEHKTNALEKINECITLVFDPNCYYNTFTLIGGNYSLMKHRMSRDMIPKYKSKCYVTSNMVDQLFIKFEGGKDDHGRYSQTEGNDVGKQKEFIQEAKIGFYRDMLVKMNTNLKRRNLEPIFEVRKEKEIDKEKEIGLLTVPN